MVFDTHKAILLVAILTAVGVAVTVVWDLIRHRNDRLTWHRALILVSLAMLAMVWIGQFTGDFDLGPISQSFALVGSILLMSLAGARAILRI